MGTGNRPRQCATVWRQPILRWISRPSVFLHGRSAPGRSPPNRSRDLLRTFRPGILLGLPGTSKQPNGTQPELPIESSLPYPTGNTPGHPCGRVARPERSDGRGESRADSAIPFVYRGGHVERLGFTTPLSGRATRPHCLVAAGRRVLLCRLLSRQRPSSGTLKPAAPARVPAPGAGLCRYTTKRQPSVSTNRTCASSLSVSITGWTREPK